MNGVSSPPTTEWTIRSIIEQFTHRLSENGFDEPRLHVELLLAHALNCSRLQLYTCIDKPLSPHEFAQFRLILDRRLAHEPLQYILGEMEFMGLPLFVNRHVLIPRPETEQLVEIALASIKSFDPGQVDVLDIGTGSGNIAIAIAAFAPNANITAIDVSVDALVVAKKNAQRNNIGAINFIHADVLSDDLPSQSFDVIVSNPPYISLAEFALLQPEVGDFEPRLATTDEADGFRFLRRIANIAAEKLKPNGLLLMEIAYNQSEEATHIAHMVGLTNAATLPDFAGHPRFLTARKP